VCIGRSGGRCSPPGYRGKKVPGAWKGPKLRWGFHRSFRDTASEAGRSGCSILPSLNAESAIAYGISDVVCENIDPPP
jgi:hypothetical protein